MSSALDFRPPARFRILRRVGVGGMGAVYEALDENTSSRVALKTLTAVAPGRVLAFKDEFRSLVGFSHPNVAMLYELLSADDQWFISMEFIEGQLFLDYLCAPEEDESTTALGGTWRAHDEKTLTVAMAPATRDAIAADSVHGMHRKGTPASRQKLPGAMRQLAEAVTALHSAGILHRDLKPSNVMISPEGHLFVLDFGLAERLDQAGQSSRSAHVSGTVTYMAPEQAAGEALSAAADWYAMGVMLYEGLSGRCPFAGTTQNVLWAKQNLDPPPLGTDIVERDPELAELCMELLRRDPARRPQGADVVARLGGVAASMPVVRRRIAFSGRETQLAMLRAAFGEVESGATKIALIVGKSGMGKSALAAHFLGGLESRRDVLILAGRCYEKESLPFKAFDSIVDSLARYLALRTTAEVNRVLPRGVSALTQVFPVLNQVEAISAATERNTSRNPARDAQELRQRAFDALRELLVRMGDLRRVVVHIDDVHWGDGDSAALLRHIVQQPDAPEMLLIATCREEYAEQGELLAALASQPDCVRVPVGPLTTEEAQRLAADLYGVDDTSAERIARESGGSPYFLQELRENTDDGGSQSSLEAVLCSRVARLPEGARRLVEIAAVSGRPLPEGLACIGAGLGGEDQRILAMLRAQRLIWGASGEIQTYHDRVREAVVAHLDAATVNSHHLALATTLEAAGGDSEAIAGHFEGAGETGRAAPHYVRAAERASGALAFDHAARLLRRAADLSPEPNEQHLLRVKLADALANAGRGVEAAQFYREVARGLPGVSLTPAEVFELERKAAYWFASSGHAEEGRETLQKMLRRVGIHVPGPKLLGVALLWSELQLMVQGIRLRAPSGNNLRRDRLDRLDVCWDALRGFMMIDPPSVMGVLALNVPLCLRTGEPERAARMLILYCIGAAAIRGGTVKKRIPGMMRVCEDLVARTNSSYLRGFLPFGRALISFLQGRWLESLEHFRLAEQIFTQECTGIAWELASTRLFTQWNLFYAGRYRELCSRSATLSQEAWERGNLYLATSLGAGPQCAVELLAGRPDEALAMLDRSLGQWTQHQYSLQSASGAFVRAWIHLYRDEGAIALDFLNREWAASRKHHNLRISGLRQWLRYTRAQCALAARQIRLAEADANDLDRDIAPFAGILAKTIRAGCASLRGEHEVAGRFLSEALREFEVADMPMMAAAARRRLGVLLGHVSLVEEADRAMIAEGVAEPERFTRIFVNGFQDTVRPLQRPDLRAS